MPDLLERHAVQQSTYRVEQLVRIFVHATRVCVAHSMPADTLN